MEAVYRLMQDSGVSGPTGREDVNENASRRELNRRARLWAMGQIGHPWDVLTVEFDEQSWEVTQ